MLEICNPSLLTKNLKNEIILVFTTHQVLDNPPCVVVIGPRSHVLFDGRPFHPSVHLWRPTLLFAGCIMLAAEWSSSYQDWWERFGAWFRLHLINPNDLYLSIIGVDPTVTLYSTPPTIVIEKRIPPNKSHIFVNRTQPTCLSQIILTSIIC